MSTDPHRCPAGAACRQAAIIDDQRVGGMTIEPDTLCDTCIKNTEDACRQLPKDWRQLSQSLGEHQSDGVKVSSTPTPAIPINTGAEAIMAAIAEVADVAAAMVSDQLNTDPPADRQHSLPALKIGGKTRPPVRGSLAYRFAQQTKRSPLDALIANVQLVQPKISVLAAVEQEDGMQWRQPQRCQPHADNITQAEEALELAPTPDEQALAAIALNGARHDAARCDDCNGYYQHGQARELTEHTGIDVCLRIARVHQLARNHLGHTRLRHHFDTACPATDRHGNFCGAFTVGRDDGSEWVNCTTCGSQWKEDEYDFLTTLIKNWRIEVLEFFLAEAYWRLDGIQKIVNEIESDEHFNQSEAIQLILAAIKPHLAGHRPPDKRKTTRDEKKKGKAKR